MIEKKRARSETARVPISNFVSGGQCHLIHLTILRRLYRLSLAYICAQRPKIPFISFSGHLHPTHVDSRLVVDEDDNGKFKLESVNRRKI